MARANATGVPLRSSKVRGLATTLTCPSYRRLLGIEPAVRRSVPVLIMAFLVTLCITGYVQTRDARERTIASTATNLDTVVALIEARLQAPGADPRAVLDKAPPAAPGAVFAVAVQDGTILASYPRDGSGARHIIRAALASHGSETRAASLNRLGDTDVILAMGQVGDYRVVGLRSLPDTLSLWRSLHAASM